MHIALILLIIPVLFILAIKGRKGHPGLDALKGWSYAHRGLHKKGVPENSMAACRAAKNAGFGIELDVHLLKDGKLAVIHDSSLMRTTGADLIIENLSAADLENFCLEETQEHIPLFSQVLELFNGEAPIIVELKSHKGNYTALCEAACNLLASYNGAYCIESFDPRCVAWFRKHRKEILRGQLTEDFFRSKSSIPALLKFIMKHQLLNFVTNPDFIAYKFSDRKTVSNYICKHLWGIQGVSWTIRNRDDFNTAVEEGWIPIFENFLP